MKIAVDIDDVLADCNAGINAFLAEEKGIFLQREDWKHFNLEDNTGHSIEEAIALYDEFHDSKYLAELALIDGSLEAIAHLATHHTIVALTSRGDSLHEATRRVIDQFTGHIETIFYTNQYNHVPATGERTTKGVICKREGIDLMIEDGLPNMESCVQHGIPVLLFDTPWNQTAELPQGVRRIHNWKEAVDLIEKGNLPSLPN